MFSLPVGSGRQVRKDRIGKIITNYELKIKSFSVFHFLMDDGIAVFVPTQSTPGSAEKNKLRSSFLIIPAVAAFSARRLSLWHHHLVSGRQVRKDRIGKIIKN